MSVLTTFQSSPLPPETNAGQPGLDAGEFIAAIRRHKSMIFAWFCFCWVVASVVIYVTPREYSASTMIMLETQRRPKGTLTSEDAQIALDSAQADSRMQVIKSERLLRYVFETLDLENEEPRAAARFSPVKWIKSRFASEKTLSKEQVHTIALLKFMDRVSARRLGLSYVIEIIVRAKTPAMAVHLANSVTLAYVRDTLSVNFREGELLQRRVADVAQEDKILTEGIKSGAIPTLHFPDADARVIAAAVEPLKPSSPQIMLIILAATVFAALTSLAVIFFQNGGHQPLNTPRQIRRRFDLGLLARIPRSRKRFGGRAELDGDQILAFHAAIKPFLRSPKNERSIIAVVNCEGGGGLGTIAFGLAKALRQSGHTPTLIDADADLTRRFGFDGQRGLHQSLNNVDPASSLNYGHLVAGCPFIPRGCADRTAFPLLEVSPMRELLRVLKENGPVLLCLPPITQSASALHIGSVVDGFVVVVQAGRTTAATLRSTLEELESWGSSVLGIVLSQVDEAEGPRLSRKARKVQEKSMPSALEVRA